MHGLADLCGPHQGLARILHQSLIYTRLVLLAEEQGVACEHEPVPTSRCRPCDALPVQMSECVLSGARLSSLPERPNLSDKMSTST